MTDFGDWFDREVETGISYSDNVFGSLALFSDRMEGYLRGVIRSAFEAGRKDTIPSTEAEATISDDMKREIEAWASGVREGLTAPDLIPRDEAEAMVAAAYEVAENCADGLSDLWHSQYKGRTSPHAGSSYKEGMSDGAVDVAAAISKLTPATARAALDKMLAEAEAKAICAAEAACVGEYLEDPCTDGDESYDRAVADCVIAVRNCLKGGENE